MPAHILPGTRGCSPSGAVLVRTYVSRASSGSVGRQPAARQGFARDGERRPRTARSLGARARQRRNPARLAGRQRLIGHRFGGVGRKKHAHMHTCIQKATQHVTKHRHAVTRPCPRALSSPVSARARPLCLLPSVLQSGRRRGSRRAAAATSPTRADLPRPRRWRGQACTAGAGPRGREGRAQGTREAEEAARASRTERRGAWHHLQWTIGSERAARR